MGDDVWRKFIAGLDIELPEKGINAPQEEIIENEADDVNGMLLKVSYDVYMFMNHNQSKYLMMQTNQKLTQIGEISLKDAILKFNKNPKKK